METQENGEIKKIIMTELPRLMRSDPDIRKFLLDITHKQYADKKETKSRFDRILDELKKERETREKKWDAQDKKWDAQEKKWDAQDKRWEAQDKKWDAQDKRWEAQEKKWEEERRIQDKKWDAQEKKWEENQKVINQMLASIKTVDRRIDSTIGALGARWGLRSERAFRDGLKAILVGSSDLTVERYEDYDHEGIVFGRPDQIELDVIVHNSSLILCEIKSSISKSEMYTFWRKKEFYEKKHNCKANRIMVISPIIDSKAKKVAGNLNIELYGYADDVKI